MKEDARWMRRALRLAARGLTHPNPMVGCVIVREGAVVGEGYHPAAGQPHAEVFALEQAGERARGATAYVTLEPCCHWGRTPPCTDALIHAGVGRVVAATSDPDPRVQGRGLAALRAAGIETSIGLEEGPARQLNEAFFHFHTTGTPFVTLKAAMTLDGKIATRTGDSRWITGEAARRYVHRLRAQSGAVLVGIGTLLADDPQLTARLPGRKPARQPLRIVVDSQLRTPPEAQAVRLAAEAPTEAPLLIAATEEAPAERARALERAGVEIARLPATADGRVDLAALCALLARQQIQSVLVEGGGELHAALLAANLAQKVLFFIAPKLVGGREAPTPVEGDGCAAISQALPLDRLRVRRFGADLAVEGYVRLTESSSQAAGFKSGS
ncbi:MAG TPA: bifunctional diaminohydroxyphosphoribosylaminopyrimidine deaminase/5-amino-6-(5-phosphoribosylamino)uracil reductase RibD [Chthonomonadaceae bacterium]|nr:bifunctional diaminohydroxyphosphoribosylaminopyrimidine deaminase/5-amino-6-(5-phosphoribosylamino)uracil reductase RibD [Chthonomonadaceae bacterium]